MKRALLLLVFFLASGVFGQTRTQRVMSGKDIFRAYRLAVVQIGLPERFSGVGFITSADGFVITANHVVATRESGHRNFAQEIQVYVTDASGRTTAYPAKPAKQDEGRRVGNDTALLKITAHGLPYVKMGDWNEVDVADQVTVIPAFPRWGTMLLIGTVANKTRVVFGESGASPADVILFQAPVRNGFSGAPIFSSSGHVIGITNTKAFGISPALEALRQKIAATSAGITVGGVNFLTIGADIITGLDQGLISGLGTGVSVSYAKEVQVSQTSTSPR